MKHGIRWTLSCLLLAGCATAQNYPPDEFPAQLPSKPPKTALPSAANPPPHSPGSTEESSSAETKIDLSPPAGDLKAHPNSEGQGQAYNPHKAMKAVEVGDFYFKRENYRAALDRYKEALQWKPADAEATFKLGCALEKLQRLPEARASYENYLKILPQGPHSKEARKALGRLPAEPENSAPDRSQVSSPAGSNP